MILGDNSARHGFVLRDLILIELPGHLPFLPFSSLGEEVKNLRKAFAGAVINFDFGGGDSVGGRVVTFFA